MRIVLGNQQLDADPEQKQAARHLEERQIKKHDSKGNEDYAKRDCARRTPENTLIALLVRQVSTRHGNDDRVVAAQQNVDHDDLADSRPMQIDQQVP